MTKLHQILSVLVCGGHISQSAANTIHHCCYLATDRTLIEFDDLVADIHDHGGYGNDVEELEKWCRN